MALRVLIVEDEPLIALDLQGIITDAGHEVCGIAARLEDALRIAESGPLDVAILDYRIADRHNGVDVARRLRQEHDVGALFVSANVDDRLRATAAEWEPFGFIAKPFTPEQIVRALQAARAGTRMEGGC